jgi:ABC-2 type transport system ATP-binding protein
LTEEVGNAGSAGKTTLIRMIAGVLPPDEGELTVLGVNARRHGARARELVGYLPESAPLYPELTVHEYLRFRAGIAGLSPSIARRAIDELSQRCDVARFAHRCCGALSKGMQQRTGLAAALVNDPQLVILDEPTDGVDPVGRREIRDLLVRMRDDGRTVFLNSHLLSEVELVCDRVAIMLKGKVERQGSLYELTHESRRWKITVEGPMPAWVAEFGAATVDRGRTSVEFKTEDLARVQSCIDRLRAEGLVIVGITETRESLEDLFMRLVRDVDGRVAAVGAGNVNTTMRGAR